MPCRDWNYDTRPSYESEFRSLTAMLCAVLTVLEKEGQYKSTMEKIDIDEAGVNVDYIQSWWKEHKKEDAKRRAAEAKRQKREDKKRKAKEAALSKLTHEERKLLGIKET